MPPKKNQSIKIADRKGKIIVWTPSDPLPPESSFDPFITIISDPPHNPNPNPKRITVFLRIKMFIKTKAKELRGTRVVSTGHNYGSTHTQKNPTIMHRFKNLLTHASKSSVDLSPHVTAHEGRLAPRGRQASWTSMCGGCRAHNTSTAPHDPAICHISTSTQDGLDDMMPLSNPRRGAISHNLADGVSSQRFQKAKERSEGLMSGSIIRSPPMTPAVIDDIRACSNVNQEDGNIEDYFANIRTASPGSDGSEVIVSTDGLFHHPFDFESRQDSDQMIASDEQEMFRFDSLESEGVSPFTSMGEPTRLFKDVQLPNRSIPHSASKDSTPKNMIDESLPKFLGLPPSLRSPVETKASNVVANIEEAMNSNIAMPLTQRHRPTSSIFSSDYSPETFIYRQHDYPHEPADRIEASLDTEWPQPPYPPPSSSLHGQSFSIDRSLEVSNDSMPSGPPMSTLSSTSISSLIPPDRSFSIERGHLEPAISNPSAIPAPQEISIPEWKAPAEPAVLDAPTSSFGSSFMEIPPALNNKSQQLDTSQTSAEFELVSSVETLPAVASAVIRKKRSSGPVMPGRYPSVSSSMYSVSERRESDEGFWWERGA